VFNFPGYKRDIKTTLRFHLTPVRMAIFKGNNNSEDAVKQEPLSTVGGNAN
jgi:hypothetical protein